MGHISLYRKWRPQTFEEVVGQGHVTITLSNALESGRLVHAYMFCGPRGTGKTSTARILAKAINCVEGPTSTPCNRCEACVSISRGNALDVIEIDAASNRKIDEIRDLLEKIPYAPTALRTKVYIIDEVHQLTPEASSALLKTLEEPPGHVAFVLATTEPHKILPTIVSRCQRFDFSLVPTREISGLLGRIASSEGIEIEDEAVGMIAEHAHGSVRDAIGVMDQIASLPGERVAQHDVAEMLGEVEADLLFESVDLLAEKDTPGLLAMVGRMVESGKDPRRFTESLIAHLRSLFLIQNAADPKEIVEATDEHYARLEEQAGRLRRYDVVRLMERLGETHREMRWSENPRLILECALVKAARTDVDISLEGLLFRLEELERRMAGTAVPAGGGAARGDEVLEAGEAPRVEKGGAEEPEGEKADGAAVAETAPEPPTSGQVEEEEAEAGRKKKPGVRVEKVSSGGVMMTGEDLKRAWAAVLSELKKQGEMRLYALLMKARVRGLENGELELAFPEDASFQMGVLGKEGRLDRVGEICSRFMGGSIALKLVGSGEKKGRRKAERPEAGAPEPTSSSGEERSRKKDGGAKKAAAGKDSGKSKDLARILSESFDGEIIEEKE